MKILKNHSLKSLNSFGVEAFADAYAEVSTHAEFLELRQTPDFQTLPRLILGGGSNMLFCNDFKGLVIKTRFDGIASCKENDHVFVTAGAGVVWNELVLDCVNKGYGGIENLTLIPGSVGASPIQNIGAYGVELKDIFHSLEVIDLQTGELKTFNKDECKFGYRQSYFKEEGKGKFLICQVTFKLSLNPQLNTSYGAIEAELENRGIKSPTIKDLSDVVGHIRQSKLPDPSTIGNAGSFFKNPIIPLAKFEIVKSKFPDIVAYPMGDHEMKVAAGWMIEQCGWKGKIIGNTGTWKNQALVLVNNGGATGQEVFDLSEQIIQSVKDKFDIQLEREVNIIL